MVTRIRIGDDPTDARHGTLNGYTNCRCRCPRCIDAHTAHWRATRTRVPPTGRPLVVHMFRCPRCSADFHTRTEASEHMTTCEVS